MQDIAGLKDELPVITLENDLEQLLQGSLDRLRVAAARAWSPALPSGCSSA